MTASPRPRGSALRSATRILATIGPASERPGTIKQLIQAGVDVFRFNMSHGTHRSHRVRMARVRSVAHQLRQPVGILVDLQGPKIRTRNNKGHEAIPLKRNEQVTIAFGRGVSEPGRIVIDFARLSDEVKRGDRILLDDGRMSLEVERKQDMTVVARVIRGGQLKEHAGVNLPGIAGHIEVPTPKDKQDIAFALAERADYIALSFVQSADDIRRLYRLLLRRVRASGRPNRPLHRPLVIAKIEKPAALRDLDDIVAASDGVMVARGDLGVEVSLEKVPMWQKRIIRKARERGAFSVTATQMLESMIENPIPTRAEISDTANAIFDGTDAVMLSAETAVGKHPIEAVRTLTRVAMEVETEETSFDRLPNDVSPARERPVEAVVRAAGELALEAGARWIVVFTLGGRTVRLLARHRFPVGIIAVTPYEETRRGLTLVWNTRTLRLPFTKSSDDMMHRGLSFLKRARLVKNGDTLVIVAGDAGTIGATNLVRLVRVGEAIDSDRDPALRGKTLADY